MILRQGYFRDLPHITQKFDYGARTDGQPEYYGWVKNEYDDASTRCVFFNFTYSISGFVTTIVSKEGSWTGRAALFA